MQTEQFNGNKVYVVHEFLTPTQCQDFINLGESIGFIDAPITTRSGPVMRKDIRNNTRVILDDPALASDLWAHSKDHIVSPVAKRQAIGLNERFRFYKYEPGQAFTQHFDGAYKRENGERSEYTFLIYLNDDFEGGQTTFFGPHFQVPPRAGSLLLFRHRQLHEGATVESGIKYVLRTDVMYEAPRDQAS